MTVAASFPDLKYALEGLPASPTPLPEGWAFTPLSEPQRIDAQKWPEGTRPWVSILMLTFRHEAFIREAIDSLLMQETTFPVEIVIHDDASPDGTPAILLDYQARFPAIFRLILQKENIYSKGGRGFPLMYEKAQGFYCSPCEGDDFWTHPLKLEVQSRLMGAHPRAVLCGHAYQVLDQRSGRGKLSTTQFPPPTADAPGFWEYEQKECFLSPPKLPATATSFFRKIDFHFPPAYYSCTTGDRFVFSLFCCQGTHLYIAEPMATYRVHSGGVYSGLRSDLLRQQQLFLTYRDTLLPTLPARWAAVAASCLGRASLEMIRLGKKEGDAAAIRQGVSAYFIALRYCLRGLRDGPGTVPPVLESLGSILAQPPLYLWYKVRNLWSRKATTET